MAQHPDDDVGAVDGAAFPEVRGVEEFDVFFSGEESIRAQDHLNIVRRVQIV